MTTLFKDQISWETYGESISAGQPLYKSKGVGNDSGRTAGRMYKLDVSMADRNVFYGIAKEAGSAADANKKVITSGRAEGFSALTPGNPVYADLSTPGAVTQVKPASNIQVIGIAQDADTVNVNGALGGSFLASEGGGGVGGVDILMAQDFESAATGDFTQTGLVLDTASPLHGAVSAKLVHQSAINQSLKQVIAVDEKFRGQSLIAKLNIKSDATAGNVTLNIYDETNAANIVASEQLQLSSAIAGTVSSVSFVIPDDCLSLSYTITALPEAGSPETFVDDIIIELSSASTLPESGLVQEADSILALSQATASFGSSIFTVEGGPFYPARFSVTLKSVGSDILMQDNSSTGSTFTIQTAGTYSISTTATNTVDSDDYLLISANSTLLAGQRYGNTAGNFQANVSATWNFNVGDVVRICTEGNNTTVGRCVITRQGSLKQASINTNSKITIPTSELRFEGSSSRGAVATAIVKFDTMAKIRGDAFTVVSTANDGTYVQMKKAGKLDVSASLSLTSANSQLYISLNQATLTSVPSGSEIRATAQAYAATAVCSISSSIDVRVNDVIRIAASGAISSDTDNSLNLSFQEQEIQVSVSNTLPQFSQSDSSVRVDTANGYGSSGTAIRRFSNIRDNIGTDVAYVDSATAGSSFTAMSSGVYSITYADNFSGAGAVGLSKNASSLSTSINSLAATERLATTTTNTAGYSEVASWTGYLAAGDIVRPHTDGSINSAAASTSFTISKVGKPNVTGVDVTPFVNIPQPVSQTALVLGSGPISSTTIKTAIYSSSGSGIFSYNTTTGIWTVLKACTVDLNFSGNANANASTGISITAGSKVSAAASLAVSGSFAHCSLTAELKVGETFSFSAGANAVNTHYINVTATAASDSILTAPETFSTDTAALNWAPAASYTLSTLSNAPVGTYITFTYGGNSNTRTQGTLRPTQTDADMNANGMLIYTRAYNVGSSATTPVAIAIQIGKGLKGKSLDLYKSAGKVTAGSLDFAVLSTNTVRTGAHYKEYNETTGVLLVDAGYCTTSSITSANFEFSDISAQTSGYLVINASKNVSLTGMDIERVSARGVSSSGQVISNAGTIVTYDSAKTFDTHGALNTATGVFTAPETGYYKVGASLLFANSAYTAANVAQLTLNKNNVLYSYLCRDTIEASLTLFKHISGEDTVFLAKGDTLSITALNGRAATTPLHTDPTFNYFSIAKTNIGGKS